MLRRHKYWGVDKNSTQEQIKKADILVGAVGVPRLIQRDWIKNGDTLIIDDYVFTISTLSASYLTLQLSEDDTSTSWWNPMNDTIYFTEKTETIKWER